MAASDPTSPPTSAEPAPGVPRPGFARRNWGKLTLLLIFGLPVLSFTVWSTMALSYTYSTGTRTGYVQKLSLKGWICKTWEGELAMATAPGVPPEIFIFSVRSDSLAKALSHDMGNGRMLVEYDEHRGVPSSCFGDTPYFVTAYRPVVDGAEAPLP